MSVGADSLAEATDALLASWSGWPLFRDAMRRCRDLDVYLAGGTMRDLITRLGRPAKDFDFFVLGADWETFLEYLAVEGDLKSGPFGSPRWFPRGDAQHYADVIPVERFDNGLWKCRDIIDALNQFDFTANAIAFGLSSRTLFDPQNGIRDAREGVMRAVRFDYPDEPIGRLCPMSRLSVLWIRLVHYASVLDFRIEPVTSRWIGTNDGFRADVETFRQFFFQPDLRCLTE